ncbi:ATP-binding protein [Archaeoglobus profundus]|uniref:Cobyrinic acid ac-diamide synthase n=1 Tax=Archaeoglobus profundus (strain DSM 5631 / JCM 9629 / NBRC 100127 / Av18) TaxID=572546 RepID=D2RDA2_ARCPA|nr:P-loop NTPase [Archaeoglobus profundus]ADB58096.1 Cobyrinic acid ac-diamide synthase [Archaeoglobus profundus DSM 5631]
MKLLVCGKGGSGKSTITALIAKSLARRGYRVLVVDGDESNLSLHRLLGVEKPKELKDLFGSRREIFEKAKNLGIRRIEEIPEEFVARKDRIRLVCVGKIHSFGEGCACPMGALLREFLKGLKLNENEFVIVDAEAGIEHFGRGVEEGCDAVIFVLDPTYESRVMAERIKSMNIDKKMYFVLNKFDERFSDFLSDLDVVAKIPFSEKIFLACLKGEELKCDIEEVEKLVDTILNQEHARGSFLQY